MNIFDKLRGGICTTSPETTAKLAQELAEALPVDTTLALQGSLGVGKTTFVRGLARGLGINASVTSPTYNIFTLHRGPRTLLHMDAYRLENAEQVEELMIEEFLTSPWCLVVEWPERVGDWLPDDTLWLQFSIESDLSHRIVLRS